MVSRQIARCSEAIDASPFRAAAARGVAIIARKGQKEGRKTAVPFGPFLALGGVIALFVGYSMAHYYDDHFLHS